MTRLTIRLLGSFQVVLGDTPITNFESTKVRALLAYLAVESNQPQRRDKLAALFWPDMTDQRANANLSRALYNLRGLIGDRQSESPYLLRTHQVVYFNRDSDYWLDIDTFVDGLPANRNGDLSHPDIGNGVYERLRVSMDLYQGNFLKGITFKSSPAFDDWVLVVRQQLERQVLGGLHLLAAYYAKRNEIETALSYAWRQVELDPLDEVACRQLMRLLATSNQRSQALAQFKRLQIQLSEELNTAPDPETQQLRDQIRGQVYTPTQSSTKGDNLPAHLTPLIGRRQELAEIQGQLDNPGCRLLTILGPGGSGKTRLALQVARTCREDFHHGVIFVPLNPVQSPTSILPAIVETLGLPRGEGDDQHSQLVNYLRNKDLLLVLDGFEHLLPGAGWLAEILRQADGLKILVTSRSRLNIKAEQLYPLGGMRCPQDAQADILAADAVQLLIERGVNRGRRRDGSNER